MTLRILQVTDTLTAGGAERMAVNVANHLPGNGYASSLATTWKTGELETCISAQVQYHPITARKHYDLSAVLSLKNLLIRESFNILHVHANALFPTILAAKLARSRSLLLWHDHYGRLETRKRPAAIYRLALRQVDGIAAVSQKLVRWAVDEMHVPAERVWYLPNFVEVPTQAAAEPIPLPGQNGYRIVCVANFRPQKDHFTLIRAFQRVKEAVPEAHLLLAGEANEPEIYAALQALVSQSGLADSVHFLGQRMDVPAILQQCEVGVLSSNSEAFPLTLIEYGLAKLGVAATNVGDCAAILQQGRGGILVPPANPDALADALQKLLLEPATRHKMGEQLHKHVRSAYSQSVFFEKLYGIYQTLLQARNR